MDNVSGAKASRTGCNPPVCVCVCTCTCVSVCRCDSRCQSAAYSLLVTLAHGCPENLTYLVHQLLTMHHQFNPEVAKQWDVSTSTGCRCTVAPLPPPPPPHTHTVTNGLYRSTLLTSQECFLLLRLCRAQIIQLSQIA